MALLNSQTQVRDIRINWKSFYMGRISDDWNTRDMIIKGLLRIDAQNNQQSKVGCNNWLTQPTYIQELKLVQQNFINQIAKGLSIKDVRSQGDCPVRTFSEKGRGRVL